MTTGNGHDAEQNMALALDEKATDPAALARRSVQARTEPIESLSPFIWYVATSQDEAPAWWTPSRDQYLRKVWRTEPMLAGAIYSVESKLKTLGWTLEGPQRQVKRYQEMLSESEFGQGWGDLVSKVVEDLLTMDRGAFIEVLRATDGSDGPVLGLAHLDASRCLPTGDLQAPVVYYDYRTGKPHRMGAHQVIRLVSQPSPDESLLGVGYCATSRILRAAQIMRDIWIYKREKLSSRPSRGIVAVRGMSQQRFDEAIRKAQEAMDNEGLTRFAKVISIATQDPGVPLEIQQLDFASLPDGYNEESSITLYAYILALELGLDARELWPATASGATKADAEIQNRKARGKGFGDLTSSIERAINWQVLPKSVTFRFDMLDDEEDKAKTELDRARIDNVVKLFTVPTGMTESVIDRLEARRLLADVQVLPEEFLANEPDVTPDVVADDVEREDGTEEAAVVQAEPVVEEVAAKELRRLYGPPARYSSKSGRVTVLEPRHPFALAAAQAAKAKATPKTGASRTRDVALPDDTEQRTEKLERSMEAAASTALGKVERLLLAKVRALPEARKATGEKAVPLADDDDLWKVVEGLFVDALGPELTAAAQAGAAAAAESVLSTVAVAVDMALVNQEVLKWSKAWNFELSRGLTDTTRKALRGAIVTWQETGLGKRGLPDLLKALEPTFGKWRAQMIGTTEVTRAFAEGSTLAYKQVPGAIGERWRTAKDEKVCVAICVPLDGKTTKFDQPFSDLLDKDVVAEIKPFLRPPAHSRCRCRNTLVLSAAKD
jgi:hypothetical protein